MHQYERIYPYINGEFQIPSMKQDFGRYGKGEMPSIVEGVGGCDVGIIEQDYAVTRESARHGWGHTGFGLLTF